MKEYETKKTQLKRKMEDYASEDVIIAFSGGVDSSLLLKMACEAKEKGKKVYGIFLRTMLHPSGDEWEAEQTAREIGAEFVILKVDELDAAGIGDNPIDRCYRCKKYLFQRLQDKAEELGIHTVLEGTNEDDLHVYRPGIRAVHELGMISPLAAAGFSKEEVRRLAAEYGISVSRKPSTPCLATRFPYGSSLSYEAVRRVEMGEAYLKKIGCCNVRLRIHENIARIEVDSGEFGIVLEHKEEITVCLKKLGYSYITLDLEGFRSGSMDIGIN